MVSQGSHHARCNYTYLKDKAKAAQQKILALLSIGGIPWTCHACCIGKAELRLNTLYCRHI